MELPELFIGAIPTVLLTLAFVQAFKEWFNLEGKAATGLSFGVGTVLAVLAQYVEGALPPDVNGWIILVVTGLAYGLAAAGFYKYTASLAGNRNF